MWQPCDRLQKYQPILPARPSSLDPSKEARVRSIQNFLSSSLPSHVLSASIFFHRFFRVPNFFSLVPLASHFPMFFPVSFFLLFYMLCNLTDT